MIKVISSFSNKMNYNTKEKKLKYGKICKFRKLNLENLIEYHEGLF